MAQNTWINCAADKAAATAPSPHHAVSGGASASGDFTISYDSAVVTSLNVFDGLVRTVRQRVVGAGLK